MQVILRHMMTAEIESIIAMLRDAEEGEERIRAAVLNEANASYGAFDSDTLVGAGTVQATILCHLRRAVSAPV